MDAHTKFSSALVGAIALAASLLTVAPAGTAASVGHRDHEGRPINFNVKAPGADAAGFAKILADAPHGDEISNVTITITNQAEISNRCGGFAEACFLWAQTEGKTTGGEIVVPAWSPEHVKQVLLHEYAHHLDASHVVQPGAKVFDGTPRWFAARGFAGATAAGQVDWMYNRGWSRSIGEIFAEDYVVLSMGDDARHRVDWLGKPNNAVLAAMAADLGETVAGIRATNTTAAAPGTAVSVQRRTFKGLARPRIHKRLRLPNRAKQRRMTISGKLRGSRKGRAVIRLRCGTRNVETIRRSARGSFRIGRMLPVGRCRVIISAKKAPVRYTVSVKAR